MDLSQFCSSRLHGYVGVAHNEEWRVRHGTMEEYWTYL